jgi:hypothetical protein
MSTLGLSGPPSSNDSLLKRLLWPSIGDASDADMLGQQGFWICLIVSLLAIVTTSLQGHWLLGLYSGIFFFIGGMGIREHDVIAAIAVTAVYMDEYRGHSSRPAVSGISRLYCRCHAHR